MLGCRERSLRAARWPNIDLENGVMRIPREDSKNGFQHQIQLTPQAIQEFRFLLRLKKKGNPYVFPGQKEKSHISQPRHLFNKIKKELMLKEPEQIVFHTARHSYASSLISAGVDVGVLKQLLGHKSISSTMRYARAGNESLRQSSQVLIQLIDEA